MKGSGAEKAEKHQLGRRVTLHFRQRPPSNNGCWTAISDEPHDKQKSGRANGRLLAVKMNAVNGKLGPIRSELFHICRKDNLRSIVLRSFLILSIIDSVMFKTKTNTDWESLMIKTTYYLHHQNQCRSKCLMEKKPDLCCRCWRPCVPYFLKRISFLQVAAGQRGSSQKRFEVELLKDQTKKKMMMTRWQILHDKKEENFAFS